VLQVSLSRKGYELKIRGIMTNKKEQYCIIEWQQQSFLEHTKIIISSAQFSIHRIELDNDESIYIVPEAFYKAAILALKKELGK
jgi:hypothetical protein